MIYFYIHSIRQTSFRSVFIVYDSVSQFKTKMLNLASFSSQIYLRYSSSADLFSYGFMYNIHESLCTYLYTGIF